MEALRHKVYNGFEEVNLGDPRSLDKSYDILAKERLGPNLKSVPLSDFVDLRTSRVVNFHLDCRVFPISKGSDAPAANAAANDEGGGGDDDGEILFPLERMHAPECGLHFTSPALVVKLTSTTGGGETPPNATFSKRGYITLVGAGSNVQFKEYLFQACYIILTTLHHLLPARRFTVGDLRISNKVVSVKTKGRFFLARLHDDLREHHFRAHMRPGICFLFVKKVFPSENVVTFSICASGVINIMGFKHDYQALRALQLLSPIFKRNLVLPSPPSTNKPLIQ
jgi:hypothetical protein